MQNAKFTPWIAWLQVITGHDEVLFCKDTGWCVFDDTQVEQPLNIRYNHCVHCLLSDFGEALYEQLGKCRWSTRPRTPTFIFISVNNCSMSNKVIFHVVHTWLRMHSDTVYLFRGQVCFMWFISSGQYLKKQSLLTYQIFGSVFWLPTNYYFAEWNCLSDKCGRKVTLILG